MNEKLPKVLKLKSKKQIESLFKNGKSLKAYPLLLIYCTEDLDTSFKVGFSVSKRFFKQAVQRNRIKRLTREVFRKKKHIFTLDETQFLLMFIYLGKELPSYEHLEKAFHKIENKWQKTLSNYEA